MACGGELVRVARGRSFSQIASVLHAASALVKPKTRAMDAIHNSDLLARVLEYACVPKEAAARKWLVSKAWLRAHDTPALWRTLKLTALPTDAPVHCLVSAWARAPERLRTLVERHTRCVIVADGGPSDARIIPQTPYTLGSGLAGQQFARLERAVIQVGNRNSAQGYAADRAALQPLFGVAWLETRLAYFGNGFLSLERSREFFQNFPNVRLVDLPRRYTALFMRAEDADSWHQRTHGLLAHDGEEYDYRFLDRQQAAQLVELAGLRANSFRHPVPLGLFPHMTSLELSESDLTMQDLATVFANVSRACPVLELLTVIVDGERDTWRLRENYSVFAHVPPRLKTLCLMLDTMELPSSCQKASQFVALVQGHLPTGVYVHVSSTLHCFEDDGIPVLDDDGLLPVAPWAPAPGPFLGHSYDDAALARATFTRWGSQWDNY